MSAPRIEQVFDGKVRPVHAGAPLLLSSQTPWTGFLLERDACHEGSARTLFNLHTSLVLAEAAPIEVEDRALTASRASSPAAAASRCGRPVMSRAAIAWRPLVEDGAATDMIRVQLDLPTLQRLAPDDDALMRRPPRAAARRRRRAARLDDPPDGQRDRQAGCPGGALLCEYLCLALAAHVAQRYGGSQRGCVRCPGGLSRRQMDAVQRPDPRRTSAAT